MYFIDFLKLGHKNSDIIQNINEDVNNEIVKYCENLDFDEEYFKGKNILLFDDLLTRGDSMRKFGRKLTSLGANVIAGVLIRMRHKGQSQRRCDNRSQVIWPQAKDYGQLWKPEKARKQVVPMKPHQCINFSPAKLTLDF